MSAIFQIAKIAAKELFYEKVFYLFFLFALCATGVSALIGQMTYTDQAKLTLDFIFGSMQLTMVFFSIFMGISLFQRELTLGSIALVLSKPLSRSAFVVGKYLGQLAVQVLVTLCMGGFTLFLSYLLDYPITYISFAQTLYLILCEIAVMLALTYLLCLNTGPVLAGAGASFFFLVGHLISLQNTNTATSSLGSGIWNFFKSILPHLEMFNMKSLASYGFTLPWNEIGIASVYALACVVTYLTLGIIAFSKKDIFT